MLAMLSRNWWMFIVRGVVAILFGLLALFLPRLTLGVLVLMFGAFALVDGIFAVVAGIVSYKFHERWCAVLLGGVVGILIGLLTFFWPNITALVLLYFIAAWAVVTGVLEIVAAIQLRRLIKGEWMMILGGLLSILLGVLLFVYPGAGALGLVWLIGAYAILFGIMLIIFAFRLRDLAHYVERIRDNTLDHE